jgi:adenylyltransferase/sulfurtransferase
MFFGPRVPKISGDELRQELEVGTVMLIDVREPNEYEIVNLGAPLIPLRDLPGRVHEPGKPVAIKVAKTNCR